MKRGTAEPLVIWDFDGTLADTRSAIMGSALAALEEHGLDPPGDSTFGTTIGLPLAALFVELVPGIDQDLIDSLVRSYRADFAVKAMARTTLFPGISTILESLQNGGARSAIATSRRRQSLDSLLEHFGIGHYFVVTFTDDDVTASKPDPEMVLGVCAACEADPQAALVIGDTAYDIEMGRRAGAATCAVTWGNHAVETLNGAEPDHMVHSTDDLSPVIESYLC